MTRLTFKLSSWHVNPQLDRGVTYANDGRDVVALGEMKKSTLTQSRRDIIFDLKGGIAQGVVATVPYE